MNTIGHLNNKIMKITEINGKVQVINETFQESFDVLNEFMEELGLPHVSEKFARKDFGIIGGETNSELQQWARDYASECHTERCASKYQY